jgi:putative RNA 2'-phosphotransferase
MNEEKKKEISKFLSLVLRHKPEAGGVILDENGWVDVDDLIRGCQENGRTFTSKELEEVVETNDKKRFSFSDDKTRIRANQGHSVEIELELEEQTPPKILYHGTAERNLGLIFENGLQKMKRHHVHLSADVETARSVGTRYGKPVIFKIDTEKMRAEGFRFFVSANEVWLVEEVPPDFLETL